MKNRFARTSRRLTLPAIALAAIGLFWSPTAAAEQPELDGQTLEQLAAEGQFDRLLEMLDGRAPEGVEPLVESLVQDLRRYRENEDQRQAQRQADFDQAMEDLAEQHDEQDLEQALVYALQARNLTEDNAALLERDAVRALVADAEAAAEEAADRGDWIQTLGYYRLLDQLHENQDAYSQPLETAMQHLRVLQVYAPERLEELYEQRRAEREEAEDEAAADAEAEAGVLDDPQAGIDLDHEDWQERLKDVEQRMLHQTLFQASTRHVEDYNLGQLLVGAVNALEVLARTDGVEATFEAMGDADRRQAFLDGLGEMRSDLDEPDRQFNFFDDVSPFLRDVRALNERTLDLPESVLIYEMTEGATATLDDFSSVIWPDDTERFQRSLQGQFTGVGIQLSRRDGQLIVVTPLPNTPAQRAGIKPGDVIAQVDGQDAAAWSMDRAVSEITGPKGTDVILGIEREGEIHDFTLTRDEIPIESISGWDYTTPHGDEWSYLIDPADGIGYVRLSQFIPQTAGDLDRALQTMNDQADGQLNGIILDLRYNPGGLLNSAIDVVDRFIDAGPIVYTVDADGQHRSEGQASRRNTFDNSIPMVVLLNQASASGSEIVAGALQSHDRATLVGHRSFGKGSVQNPYPLDRGQAILKLTTEYYTMPDGRIIDRRPGETSWGVEPDLLVHMSDEQMADAMEHRQQADIIRDENDDEQPVSAQALLSDGLDPQLESALLVLKARMVAKDVGLALGAVEN